MRSFSWLICICAVKASHAATRWRGSGFASLPSRGISGAQFQLAVMHCTGQVRRHRPGGGNQAWYRRAGADQGDRVAQYNLAVMLAKGDGVEQSNEEAFAWCRKAAEQPLPEAEMMLGDSCLTSGRAAPRPIQRRRAAGTRKLRRMVCKPAAGARLAAVAKTGDRPGLKAGRYPLQINGYRFK